MNLVEDFNPSRYKIRSCSPGQVVINEKLYTQSLIVSPSELIYPWRPCSILDLNEADIVEILDKLVGVVLLGTGNVHHFPETAVLAPLYAANKSIEIMSTEAACRTFAALSAEHREVSAALIID